MNKKVLVLLLGLICMIGGAFSVYLYTKTDREGPKIQLTTGNILYHENEDTSILLDGVTAVDDVDGDVTDSLIVEAIYPSADGAQAKIVYAAMDSNNNVTKKQRIVDYIAEEAAGADADGASTDETEANDDTADNNTGDAGNDTDSTGDMAETTPTPTPTSTPTPTPTLQAESTSGAAGANADAKIAVVNGSGVAGVAGDWQDYLENEGYRSVQTGSYLAEPEETVIYTEDEELDEIPIEKGIERFVFQCLYRIHCVRPYGNTPVQQQQRCD